VVICRLDLTSGIEDELARGVVTELDMLARLDQSNVIDWVVR